MARTTFQVLVIPYQTGSRDENGKSYAVFRRREETGGYWQWIAGGGESGESPLVAARREAFEEAGISLESEYIELDSYATVPKVHFAAHRDRDDLFVIPEYSFGVRVESADLRISSEHKEYTWLPYDEAYEALRWDSNRNALWELDRRLCK